MSPFHKLLKKHTHKKPTHTQLFYFSQLLSVGVEPCDVQSGHI